MARSPACPNQRELERMVLGELSELEAEQLGQHILACSRCTVQLELVQSAIR